MSERVTKKDARERTQKAIERIDDTTKDFEAAAKKEKVEYPG